jgi:hypothetical protein
MATRKALAHKFLFDSWQISCRLLHVPANTFNLGEERALLRNGQLVSWQYPCGKGEPDWILGDGIT